MNLFCIGIDEEESETNLMCPSVFGIFTNKFISCFLVENRKSKTLILIIQNEVAE